MHTKEKEEMWIIFAMLIFGGSESTPLYECNDEIFNNELKDGNWICKIDKDYDKNTVPKPLPQKLDSILQIYEVSDVDEIEHTISIHFKHYIRWTDKSLSYHNRSIPTKYLILYGERKDSIWYPQIMYIDSIEVEKKTGMGPGFENPHEFKMFPNNRIQLSENVMVKFSCEFDFKPYPFDKHECNLAWYDRNSVKSILMNQVMKIAHLNETFYKSVKTRDDSLSLSKPRSDFKIWVDINQITRIKDGKLSSAGVMIHLQRDGLALLMGSFYIPTGIFAVLAMTSYVINPDAVPGRMGLLITSSLISWNVYGSTKAPPSRGFSYIEVWISGVQTNIIGAICEYSCILAIRRTKLTLSIKSADMEKIITLIDFGAFVISFIYFTMFNLVYWFGTH